MNRSLFGRIGLVLATAMLACVALPAAASVPDVAAAASSAIPAIGAVAAAALSVITPTVGRKVWYWPSAFDKSGPGAMYAGTQPLDATVVYVHGDRMVNLLVLDAVGKSFPKTSVTLLQEGDAPPPVTGGGGYAEWMPYQKGQAAKAT